ncbi:MAG TPA: polysaccharide deacetylase family protein [Pseudoxanthomonas sp.]|nr:polysaccharide deacetylase family protein [Pseudoxanthomonas sp.]
MTALALLRRLALLPLLACAPAHAGDIDRRIAVTIDDLPWQRAGAVPAPVLRQRHDRLMAQLAQAGVPATGFVNEIKLEVDGRVAPERVAMLRDWLEAGHTLGNHGYSHPRIDDIGARAYCGDIERGEQVLRPLLREYGQAPRWFRHPYLRAGRDAADRVVLQSCLERLGYEVAPVTVDNSEWIWASAYARVLDGAVQVDDREAALERLRRGYVPYMLNKVDYYERQSIDLLGRAVPQVWLLHANELNAAAYAGLVAGVQRRGYRVVTLDEAMRDPAYARGEGGYTGARGISWLHRWALAEGRPPAFFAGEPTVPRWVLDLAGMASE